MALTKDLKVLYHIVLSPIKGNTHKERLESFYGDQADAYDDFRKRLLKGREEMYQSLPVREGDVLLDMGGGTGYNLEALAPRMGLFQKVYVVDLSGALLGVAQKRIIERGWTNVVTQEADVTTFEPPEAPVDLVTFSYSLTMIPNWYTAIDHAHKLLKPGGHIGVVDFYVSRKYPAEGHQKHSWFTRNFWPVWFSSDNVFPQADHVPYLHERFRPVHFSEHFANVPYIPFVKTPYYRFVGQKV